MAGGPFDAVVNTATVMGLIAANKALLTGATKVAVINPTNHVGGATTGGLGKTDVVGQPGAANNTRWGFIKRFYQQIAINPPYNLVDGSEVVNFSSTEAILAMTQNLLADSRVTVVNGAQLKYVTKAGTELASAVMANGDVYTSNYWIDCSYEGDLAAMAGCSMSYGRDSSDKYRERVERTTDVSRPGLNIEGAALQTFKSVDGNGNLYPWRTAPPPLSRKDGSPDSRAQAYGWRFSLSTRSDRLPWPMPPGYDRQQFLWVADMIINNGGAGSPFPIRLSRFEVSGAGSGKYTTNGGDLPGTFTNGWTRGSYADRVAIQNKAYSFTAGILYFAANDTAVPQYYRDALNLWGLPADEFQIDYIGSPGWPANFYVRESRHLDGQYKLTTADMFDDGSGTNIHKPDSIGVGGYPVDAHSFYWYPNADGVTTTEEGRQAYTGLSLYDVPLRSILPWPEQCSNLIVPVAGSFSTLALDSLRMEPTWSVLAESAGTLVGLALTTGRKIGAVPYAELYARLIADGAVLRIN